MIPKFWTRVRSGVSDFNLYYHAKFDQIDLTAKIYKQVNPISHLKSTDLSANAISYTSLMFNRKP